MYQTRHKNYFTNKANVLLLDEDLTEKTPLKEILTKREHKDAVLPPILQTV